MLLQILPYGEDERHPDRLIFKFDYSFHHTFSYVNHEIRETLKAVTPKAFRKNQSSGGGTNRVFCKISRGDGIVAQLPGISADEIIFVLPGSFRKKLTIVISPLGALLHEQGTSVKINYRFQPSAYIDPAMNREERKVLCTDIKLGKIRLVYINPYNLNIKQYRDKLKLTLRNIPVQNVILDAAHCLSEWGHDFKPFYRKIPEFINWLRIENPELTLLALTPNTSPIVRRDIMEELGLVKEANNLAQSLYRDNLSFQVVTVKNPEEKAEAFERAILKDIPTALHHENLVTVFRTDDGYPSAFCIYADASSEQGADFFLNQTQKILTNLSVFDLKDYDAPKKIRLHVKNPVHWPKYIYSYFMSSSDAGAGKQAEKDNHSHPGPLITTRIPDMDVNTDAIRFVIHTSMPPGIENWFREASRAGRDGERAHCLQIIEMPESDCEKDMQTRMTDIPLCSEDGCRFGRRGLCDFGRQHVYIRKSSRNIIRDAMLALHAVDQMISGVKAQDNPLIVRTSDENIKDYELALYRLIKLGVIQGYQTDIQDGNPVFEVTGFSDRIDPDYIIHSLLQFLKENDLSDRSKYSKMMIDDLKRPGGEIHRRRDRYEAALQEEIDAAVTEGILLNCRSHQMIFQTASDCLLVILSYISENVTAMRYRMLRNIREYLRCASCRHAELLKHFQMVNEDWKCRCCDLCLPGLNFLYSDKNYLPAGTDGNDPGRQLEDWLTNDMIPFDAESARQFLQGLSVHTSGAFCRANFFLEKSPRNLKALFTAREFAPASLKGRASADLMAIASCDLNFSGVRQVYLTSPDSEDIRAAQFDILDDVCSPCNSPEGMKWLYSEGKKLPLDSSRIRQLGANVFVRSLKNFEMSGLLSKLDQLTEEF